MGRHRRRFVALLIGGMLAGLIAAPAQAHFAQGTKTYNTCTFAWETNHSAGYATALTKASTTQPTGCTGYKVTIVYHNGTYWTSCTKSTTIGSGISVSNHDTGCDRQMTQFSKSTHQGKGGNGLWGGTTTIYH